MTKEEIKQHIEAMKVNRFETCKECGTKKFYPNSFDHNELLDKILELFND